MKPYSLLFLGGWGISLLVSCAAEEDALYAKDAAQGRIVLSMPQLEPFLEVRAEQTLTDFAGYTFTLKGTNSDGWTVNETLQLQKEGKQYSCIIPAGNYTLTADNATAAVAGNGAAYYNGTSPQFSLTPGGNVAVSISLGKPQNAMISLSIDDSFSRLYDLTTVNLTDGERTVSLTTPGNAFFMIPASGRLSYTIQAKARSGSHVSDLPADGITRSLTVSAGNAYPIRLTAKAIEDMLIEIGNGSHGGEFNAPAITFPQE